MIRNNKEWFDWIIEKGSSGEQCYDIIEDWNEELKKHREIIQELLDCLPDHTSNGQDWDWCWDELFEESQEKVKQVRKHATDLLESKL